MTDWTCHRRIFIGRSSQVFVLRASGLGLPGAFYNSVTLPEDFSVETDIWLEYDGPHREGLFAWGNEGYLVLIDLTYAFHVTSYTDDGVVGSFDNSLIRYGC